MVQWVLYDWAVTDYIDLIHLLTSIYYLFWHTQPALVPLKLQPICNQIRKPKELFVLYRWEPQGTENLLSNNSPNCPLSSLIMTSAQFWDKE